MAGLIDDDQGLAYVLHGLTWLFGGLGGESGLEPVTYVPTYYIYGF